MPYLLDVQADILSSLETRVIVPLIVQSKTAKHLNLVFEVKNSKSCNVYIATCARFLKPVATCPHCLQDWTHQQADDFPAYVSILLTGHIMAPIIIALVQETALSLAGLAAIIVLLMLALMIGFIQPAKGAIIALQWWFGMHGFEKERRDAEASDRKQ